MNSRERVLKAIDHLETDITPINIEGIYGNIDQWYERFHVETMSELRDKLGGDIQGARPVYVGPNAERGLTIWGTPIDDIYGVDGVGYGTDRVYPLADARTIADIEAYDWPSPDDFDYQVAAELLNRIPDSKAKRIDGKYGIKQEGRSHAEVAVGGPWVPLICTMFDLFGLENVLMKLHLEPKLMEAAAKKVGEFNVEFYRRMLEATKGLAQIGNFCDDFATQKGMLLSPSHWRKYLKPTYQEIFELIKSSGMKVWMHSCGSFRPVMGDLIDIGLDVWETVQLSAKGNEPDELKRTYGKHITFAGGISTQTTLPFGSTEDVRREVRQQIRVLGTDGGYICAADHGIMPDVPIDNVVAMCDEARKFRF